MAYQEVTQPAFNMIVLDDVGATFEGVVKSKEDGLYGPYWIITRDDIDYTTPSHKVLVNRLKNVLVGAKVRITKLESLPPKIRGHNPTTMYKVEVDE